MSFRLSVTAVCLFAGALAAVIGGPLTIRLHKAVPKVGVAQVPTKPEKVSLFEDRTLKRGDAVMTADGIRVFAGSASWPYTKAEFVDLATAKI